MHKVCTHSSCIRRLYARGYCTRHYARLLKYNDVNKLGYYKNSLETFHAKYIIDDITQCWIWIGFKNPKKYGYFSIENKKVLTHRFSYEQFIGRIPHEMCVLHECDTPSCVNPKHLFLGTHADNVQDKINKKRQAIGEKNGKSKLTIEDIKAIKRHLHLKILSIVEISYIFNVTATCIHYIKKNLTWNHFPLPSELAYA